MDERMIPINGLIALLRGEGGWPDHLRHLGFERYQLEVPISTELGDIRADALIYRVSPNLILLGECKSGRNIEEEQARKYQSADIGWLRRGGVVPPRLRQADEVAVEMLLVGREEHRADLESSLRQVDLNVPLLTVGSSRVRLSGASATPGLDDFDRTHGGGLPPARFPVDHQSGDQDVLELLIPEIVAAQAHVEEIVAVESLSERLLPEWPVLSNSARADFVRRAAGLLRDLSSGEMRGQFRYESGLPQIRGGASSSSIPLRQKTPVDELRRSRRKVVGRETLCDGPEDRSAKLSSLSMTSPKREGWQMSERT